MSRQKKIIIFSALFLIVLAIPVYLVVSTENLLAAGEEHTYKFRIRPIDPHDMMRGKYIRLHYRMDEAEVRESAKSFHYGDAVYVTVQRDSAGFGYFEYADHNPPKTSNYFTTKIGRTTLRSRGLLHLRRMQIQIPFDRYYLNEEIAQQAEDSYNRMARGEEMYAEVVIKDGECALKEVYVDGVPLKEYLEKNRGAYELEKQERAER